MHISSFHRSFRPGGDPAQSDVRLQSGALRAREARAILQEFRPDAVIGTGGYASFPMVKAAARAGIPTAVHESNMVPGLTTRMLEPYADRILVGFESCRQYYRHPEKVAVTGTPVREDFFALTQGGGQEAVGHGRTDGR